ncbi:hypothetical protein MKEN_00058200 [Mycena kentingensis (nom. inval.)]|nr:hypothetical protein MKEN_00058200 [Mycena kentingensis (nom. inval.)]
MGVPGLWKELEPAATARSLTHLAVADGFQANPDAKRGFRVGIDASIWFFHAEYGKEGENPELRTMFFRCATLMHAPFLPLFVFDGKHRPTWKRGKRVHTGMHKLTNGMKDIVEAFGFEWRVAPGEAEAELAYLNRIGVIDGVLSDDVDNFLFGARTVIRNPSNKLSGNRSNPVLNADGRDDNNHSRVFRMDDIETHPDISLTRADMILIGLLSGGDYDTSGMTGCGPKFARGLVRYGLGKTLYDAAKSMSKAELVQFLPVWREQLRHELRTDSKGYIGSKRPSLAKQIPDAFPDVDILLSYVNPLTSESLGRASENIKITWAREPDLGRLARTCEFYFEWGYRNMIVKRFKTVIWHGAVLRILRRGVLETKSGVPAAEGTPSKLIAKHFSSLAIDDDEQEDEDPLITKITRTRNHASTDGILEYRLEINPRQLVHLTESGIENTRRPEDVDEYAGLIPDEDEDEEEGKGKKRVNKWEEMSEEEQRALELKPVMVWMPACMVDIAEPRLVREWQQNEEKKRLKKAGKGTGAKRGKGKAITGSEDEEEEPAPKPKPKAQKPKARGGEPAASTSRKTVTKKKTIKPKPLPEEEEMSSPSKSPPARKIPLPKPKQKSTYVDMSSDEEEESGILPVLQEENDPFSRAPRAPPARDLTQPKASTSKSVVRDLTRRKPAANTNVDEDLRNFYPLARARNRTVNKASASAPVLQPIAARQARPGVSAPVSDSNLLGKPSQEVSMGNENSPSKPKPTPRPFPFVFDAPQVANATRRRGSDASDVSTSARVLNKSPRKSREHTSPRKQVREASPSPIVCRPPRKEVEVIDISSDEETRWARKPVKAMGEDVIVVSD